MPSMNIIGAEFVVPGAAMSCSPDASSAEAIATGTLVRSAIQATSAGAGLARDNAISSWKNARIHSWGHPWPAGCIQRSASLVDQT
jgi:hypothetical protein